MNKELCECGKMAVWCYEPGYSNGDSPYFCDDCVHHGCTCNWDFVNEFGYPEGIEDIDWKWITHPGNEHMNKIEKGECWTYIDEQGREYPCCEYGYDENGFDID